LYVYHTLFYRYIIAFGKLLNNNCLKNISDEHDNKYRKHGLLYDFKCFLYFLWFYSSVCYTCRKYFHKIEYPDSFIAGMKIFIIYIT